MCGDVQQELLDRSQICCIFHVSDVTCHEHSDIILALELVKTHPKQLKDDPITTVMPGIAMFTNTPLLKQDERRFTAWLFLISLNIIDKYI